VRRWLFGFAVVAWVSALLILSLAIFGAVT
jgi:hypothetical protein